MATSTYIALANLTLSANQGTVTFSSIPATYRDLVLVTQVRASTSGSCLVRFNSDTGSNYTRVSMYGDGSTATSETSTTTGIRIFEQQSNEDINNILHVMDYSATDKHKTTLNRWNRPAGYVFADAARWANTNAITSITIVASGNLLTGSTFALYGIVS